MTVYVDQSRLWPSFRRDGVIVHRAHSWCHLWADSADELHRFAARLGLKRKWFQDRTGFPHYDLMGDRMRAKAISAGAVALSSEESVRRILAARGWPPAKRKG